MSFIGRTEERAALEKAYSAAGFGLFGIYGRRRIGKTTLLHEFCQGKRHIFLTAREVKLERNIEIFSKLLFQEAGIGYLGLGLSLNNLQNLISYIGRCASSEKLIVVIDEFQYLSEAEPSFIENFRRGIAYELANKNILLVICGASFDAMQELFDGDALPDKRDTLCLMPFNYREAAELTPAYTAEEKLLVYGVTGGVPGYTVLFDTKKPALTNISELFFAVQGHLYDEAKSLLRQDFRNVSLYNTLLEVIGQGAGRMNAIAKGSGYDTPVISPAIKKLIANGMVEKTLPILNEDSKRDAEYVINDGLLKFYYRFVSGGITEIEAGAGGHYFETAVRQGLSDHLGDVFEAACRQYTLLRAARGDFSEKLVRAGKWKSTDAKKRSEDIDVVAVNAENTAAVIGECRYRNASMEAELIDQCIETGKRLDCRILKYLMFSKNGYYPTSLRKYRNDERVELLTLKDLYI